MKNHDEVSEEMNEASRIYATIINGTGREQQLHVTTALLDGDSGEPTEVIVLVLETREGHPNHPMMKPIAVMITNHELEERVRPIFGFEDYTKISALIGPHRLDDDGGYHALVREDMGKDEAQAVVDQLLNAKAAELSDEDFIAGINKILAAHGGDEDDAA